MNATITPPKVTATKPEAVNGDKVSATTTGREALIAGLNHDLAGEYQAIVMYILYSAKLTGPFRRELRALFQAEVVDEQGHAQFLSDKIAAMGGEPTTEPRPITHVNLPREMLDSALRAEVEAIADYTTRIGQAEACGEIGLKVSLEGQLADETRHKEELERIIDGWNEVHPERLRSPNPLHEIGGQG